ncbi:MAG: hypothetical protein JXK05_03505 [Campylobacterales bacterium]|nr:hypothetical protein [Campylobacterales bacterium]
MEITQYASQSSYPQQVQVGKRDPSSQQSDRAQDESMKLATESNQTVRDAEVLAAQQQQERESVAGGRLLDMYA